MAPAPWDIPVAFPDFWSSQEPDTAVGFVNAGTAQRSGQPEPRDRFRGGATDLFKQKHLFALSSCFGFSKAFPELPGWEKAFKFSFSFCSKKRKPFPAVVPSKHNRFSTNPP